MSIEQGTLRLGVADALGSRAIVSSIADGAVLDLNGFNLGLSRISNVSSEAEIKLGTGTLVLRTGGDISGAITGAGAVVLGQSGFSSQGFVFRGANTFSGGLTIQAGARLFLLNPNALGVPGNPITLDGGSLGIGSQAGAPLLIDSSTPLTITGQGGEFAADGQSILIASQLTGSNPIRFSGGSAPGEVEKFDVRLLHANNTFTGPVQLASAIIGIVADGSLGDGANVLTMGQSTFDGEVTRSSRGGLRAYADVVLPSSRVIRLDGSASDPESSGGVLDTNGHTIIVQGAISGVTAGMPLVKTGEGTLLLNGQNTYTGPTEVQEGTLGGTGVVHSVIVNAEGTLAPGASAGLFTVVENLEFSSGTFSIELGGTTRGMGFDALDVGGSMSLGSATLRLTFLSGFQSTVLPGDTFNLVEADSLSGEFNNVASGERLFTADGFGSFRVSYGAGSPFGEGSVVLSEYVAVPEPTVTGLCVLGAFALASRRRRSSSRHV